MTEVSESESAYQSLMQFLYRAPIGLVQSALDGTVEMINPMSANLLMPLVSDGDLDNLFTALERVAPWLPAEVAAFGERSGTVCDSVRIPVAHEGVQGAVSRTLSLSVLKLDEKRLMAMISDVTQEVEREQTGLERSLHAAARIDVLTRMPNRAAMWELVNTALEQQDGPASQPFAVLFVNCDRFKQINNLLGHGAGDELLGLMAERLQSTLRQEQRGPVGMRDAGRKRAGDTAGRIGGDEFVVLVRDLRSAEDAHAVARRLLAVLSKPYSVRSQRLHVGISMGVVLREDMSGDADTVLQDASIAMREAKRAGGGRHVLFEPSMHERALRRSAAEVELRRALAQGELFVVFQPVVDLRQDEGAADRPPGTAGVEALVRWRHPERGLIPPVEFIGIAEECGLIGAIGEFVLRVACEQFVQWQGRLGDMAPRLLAVNLSRGQLVEPGFAAVVARVLASTGLRADQLQLEITESLAAQDEAVQAELRALKALGLSLALDDFGTGYSSLSSLHQLPVSTVKIDRSFVSDAVESPHHQVLIEATIRVARSLGMTTVAEGIETQEQCELVRELGCNKGQGYFFCKPLVASDLLKWLPMPDASPAR